MFKGKEKKHVEPNKFTEAGTWHNQPNTVSHYVNVNIFGADPKSNNDFRIQIR